MFAKRLKEARKKSGLSQKELAKRLFISQQAYAKYELGSSSPNPDMLSAIAANLMIPVSHLLEDNEQDPSLPPPSRDGKWVPVLGRVSAGIPLEAIEEVIGYEEISLDLAITGEYFALQINGDSMVPRIKSGDVVIVRKQNDCENGDIAVILVNGEEATVKRIKKRPEGVMLIPMNTNYEPIFYSNKEIASLPVIIVGKVVELRAKF